MIMAQMTLRGMRHAASYRARLLQMTLIILIALHPSFVAGEQPDALTIIRRSVDANQRDWNAAPEYSFRETDREGKGSRTYQVMMIDGSPFQTLMAVNGKLLGPDELAKQQADIEKTAAQRRSESPHQRETRIAKYQAERRQEHLLMQPLTEAFDFKLVGEQTLGSFKVYALRATPRKDYKPPNIDSQVLPGMQGRLWIDRKTFQWVRITARVIRPVSIAGFLAQVERGTYFEVEKMPVSEGVWLPKHYVMRSRSKILFFIGHNTQANETYFDYEKSGAPR